MNSHLPVRFQEALEVVESLPYAQQENLIDIILHRLTEHKRGAIAHNIKVAREEYARGDAKTGTLDDLMEEIAQ